MSNDNYPINIFSGIEQASNLEQKCLCVLVVDVSSSMGGEPIKQLNAGLQDFQRDVIDDFVTSQRLEVSIVTFGSSVDCVQKPALIDSFQMPTLGISGSRLPTKVSFSWLWAFVATIIRSCQRFARPRQNRCHWLVMSSPSSLGGSVIALVRGL